LTDNTLTDNTTRTDGNHCFVCGPDNPAGLQVKFRLEGDVCRAEFTPATEHCGYSGVTHGGILFSLLDDVMANWLYLQGERAYTARCELRFREPAPTGEKLLFEGELVKRKGRTAIMRGKASLATNGNVVAEASATFMVADE
jgi:acyl-coenzyme A thioesterase PaaI-like protein